MPRPVGPSPNNRGGKMERPLTVKDSDLKSLDQEKDDNGWAAAQDEVDYNAKLNFDESDDSDDDRPSKRHESKQHKGDVCIISSFVKKCTFVLSLSISLLNFQIFTSKQMNVL